MTFVRFKTGTRFCKRRPYGGRHTPLYHEGHLVTTDPQRLQSRCYWCDSPIARVNKQSAWWRTIAESDRTERAPAATEKGQ